MMNFESYALESLMRDFSEAVKAWPTAKPSIIYEQTPISQPLPDLYASTADRREVNACSRTLHANRSKSVSSEPSQCNQDAS